MKKILIPVFIVLCLFAYIIGFTTTTTTDNLSLVIPAAEDTTVDWFDTVNANFELVDDIFDTVTLTEFGYLDGVTSAIQTQLDAKIEATLTEEQVEDYVGAMTTGNTETFITVTYQDATADIDFVVPVKDEDNMASDSATFLVTQQSVKKYADDLHALQYLKTELDDFSELQGIISDKTLVNEEDICTIDANWVNIANPWADDEVANDITINLATLATTITVTDNEATNENNPLCFVAGADPDGGSLGIETDGDLHYNPSTGLLTATAFAGALTGNVTGDASGSSGSCTGNAATCTTASAGDAAVDFFGAGVDAVTDATTCTDVEGTLLSIGGGTLNAAIPADHITYDMMQDTSDTDKILGRSTAGAGTVEEIACTAAGRAILDDANASAQRTTLGLVIGTNVLAEQTIGIADDNLVEIDHASVADNDIPKFTANGLEGRSPLEHRNDVENYVIYPQDYATGAGTVGDPWTGNCLDDAYNASSAGDIIYMRAGYYQLDVVIAVDTAGVSFIGEGINRTIIKTADTYGFTVTVDDVTLQGFTIDGTAQASGDKPCINISTCDYIVVRDIEAKESVTCGIQPLSVSYCLFENLYLHDNGEHGIHPGDVSGSSVKSKNNTYRNIYGWDNTKETFADKGTNSANRPYWSNNTYDNIHSWDDGRHGISIVAQRGITASNLYSSNYIGLTDTGYGIYLRYLHDSTFTNCIVKNHYSSSGSAYGIQILDSTNLSFMSCIANNNETGGFRIHNSTNITLTNCQATDSRTLTGVDIAFVDGGAGADTITMTDARFLEIGLWAGKDITITGAGQAGNNSTFTITSVVAGTITLPTASLTTEAAGATVTIVQEKTQPYGLAVESASDNINLINCNFTGNLTGKIYTSSSYNIKGMSTHDITVDHDYSGTFESGLVGETVTFGQLLYFNWTDKEWKETDADAAATMPGLRIALQGKTNGTQCLMLIEGKIRDDSFYAFAGSIVYAGCAVGECTSTAPSASGDQVQRIGVAETADIFYFDPSLDQGEI